MHKLPELGYSYDALEPYIDAKTMEIHHTKHHQAYINKLNAALESNPMEGSAEELISNLSNVPETIRTAVRNHGGGHANHSFFWTILKKDVEPSGGVVDAINQKWGSLEKFKEEFTQKAVGLFGSGWAWLVLNNGSLEVVQTPNQDSPLTHGMKPLIGLDVWEHAYYLKYQNRRPDYVNAFFNVINWERINQIFKV